MNDIERVRALRDAGQITPEEAERLISVLTELDESPENPGVEAAGPAAPVAAPEAAAPESAAPAPGVPEPADATSTVADRVRAAAREAAEAAREAAREAAGAAREASSQAREAVAEARTSTTGAAASSATVPIDLAPAGTRWCTVEMTAADLSVVADDVDEPVVEGDEDQKLIVTPTDDGVRVTSERGWSIDRWVGRGAALDVRVRLPRAWGLALDLKAGDADVAGVPYVRGRMLAGDLSVRDAASVDLSKAAGDLSVAFRPTQGQHRIAAKAGDVDVRFLPGSDAAVEASVSMGDLHAPGFEVDDRMVGAQARGRIGAGNARVEVRLTAGDLSLRAPAKEG
jgi:hypothetical protein